MHMSSTDNEEWARRRLVDEVWNRGNVDSVDGVFAPDFVGHDPNRPEIRGGADAVKASVRTFHTAFPDLSISVDDLFAAGDRIVWRYTLRGTHRARFLGVEATGRKIEVTGISIFRRAGGLLREGWIEFDGLGLLRQLGALPERP
jgi:steroid delta-isomerase-like uncharacterized protein